MSFEEAYGYYAYGDPSSFQAGSSGYADGQGPYYPPGIHSSYGPQVGPSASARFNYEDPIMRSISDLSSQITTLGTQQQQMQDTIAHNTQLAQQSWGLTSAMHYDVSNVFLQLGLDHQPSQPYYQTQQYQQLEHEGNDDEDEGEEEEDPDEEEEDSDEED